MVDADHRQSEHHGDWSADENRSARSRRLIEYGLLLTLVAVVCVVAIGFVGKEPSKRYCTTASYIGPPVPMDPHCPWNPLP
jgi:hypothetical protein